MKESGSPPTNKEAWTYDASSHEEKYGDAKWSRQSSMAMQSLL